MYLFFLTIFTGFEHNRSARRFSFSWVYTIGPVYVSDDFNYGSASISFTLELKSNDRILYPCITTVKDTTMNVEQVGYLSVVETGLSY